MSRSSPPLHNGPLLTYEKATCLSPPPLFVRFHQTFLDFDTAVSAKLAQPGNREWATVIQVVSSEGWCVQRFTIVAGRSHLSTTYEGWSCTARPGNRHARQQLDGKLNWPRKAKAGVWSTGREGNESGHKPFQQGGLRESTNCRHLGCPRRQITQLRLLHSRKLLRTASLDIKKLANIYFECSRSVS
jgi:hypothetical protein